MLKIAWDMLAGCSGCEITLLDIGEPLLDLLPAVDFVHMPLLQDCTADSKPNGQTAIIPKADVGILSGCVRTLDHIQLAQEMRRQCKTVIALGACACTGGIPALANLLPQTDLASPPNHETSHSKPSLGRDVDTPALTDRVYALDEIVIVDGKLVGCPPTPESLAGLLSVCIKGTSLPEVARSVCDDCPTQRQGKMVDHVRRPLEPAPWQPDKPLSELRCLLEQGFLCMGPVTKTGCGGPKKTPCCIQVSLPCRGCFGPLRSNTNPVAGMIGVLVPIGFDIRQIKDRMANFYRYSGLTGKGRPLVRLRAEE